MWLFLAIAALTLYVFVLGLFEVYYFITLGLTAFVARFFKKRTHIMDMTTVTRKFETATKRSQETNGDDDRRCVRSTW